MRLAAAWLEHVQETVAEAGAAGRVFPGIAPQALYSVSEDLLRRVVEFADRSKLPRSLHLAECEAESAFLREGSGEFVPFLAERGVWDPSWRPAGVSPVVYADRLGLLRPRTLLIHANYLSESDIRRLAAGSATVVYCPGTHRFFGHRAHPVDRLLRAGVAITLGTESLAANDRLDLLHEAGLAAAMFPAVEPEEWVRAITLTPAHSLGLGAQCGSLTLGKVADFAVAELEDPRTKNPCAALVRGEARVSMTVIAGEVWWDARAPRSKISG
jgi:cytosine/adenosine deaminase-related metal-dependent hydrolase